VRGSAVTLLAAFFCWLAFVIVGDSLPLSRYPSSCWGVAFRLGMLLLGPFCWLALILIQIRETKHSRLTPDEVAHIEEEFRSLRMLGPIGNLVTIFRLTKGA
jgi:hypothetical protein